MTRNVASNLGLVNEPISPFGVRVLTYHGVSKTGRNDFNSRFISANYFEKQINYFKKHFNLVSVADVFSRNLDPLKLNVALTFDDGYANNYKNVLPVLEKYGAPASFYITGAQNENADIIWPDFVDMVTLNCNDKVTILGKTYIKNRKGELIIKGKTLKQICKESDEEFKLKMMKETVNRKLFEGSEDLTEYWKQMTPEQLQVLSTSEYVTIGSHGYYHNNLENLEISKAKEEVVRSKTYLEDLLQIPILEIAYPDGSYSLQLKNIAEELGFQRQLAVDYKFEEDVTDPRIIDRFGINPFISWHNQLHCLVNNSYW